MNSNILEAIVIGAGHAGLSASYYLKKSGIRHIILERGKAGESWRSQRWRSFALNSPNNLNQLPGQDSSSFAPDHFAAKHEFIKTMDEYVLSHALPLVENAKVLSVYKNTASDLFEVTVMLKQETRQYYSRQVIIASGCMNKKLVPSIANQLSPAIKQFHSSEYLDAAQLPAGGVLVVGSGQSGCQIAADLVACGKQVYLSTSMVARLPRRYRGKDIMNWLHEMNFFEEKMEDVKDPQMLNLKAPQLTGIEGGRLTISLQSLAKKGVILVGKMNAADGKIFSFENNAAMHVQFADGFSQVVKNKVDEYILHKHITAPGAETDENDVPDVNAACASNIVSLDADTNNIASVIWATGFTADFTYIKLPIFDDDKNVLHKEGVSEIDGLYFIGLPWQRKRLSFTLQGMSADAAFICDKVKAHAIVHRMVDAEA